MNELITGAYYYAFFLGLLAIGAAIYLLIGLFWLFRLFCRFFCDFLRGINWQFFPEILAQLFGGSPERGQRKSQKKKRCYKDLSMGEKYVIKYMGADKNKFLYK